MSAGARAVAALLGVGFAAFAAAAQPGPAMPIEPLRMAECAAIGAAADRLACYDRLAGRALPDPSAAVPATSAAADSPAPAPSLLAPQGLPIAEPAALGGSGSLMSRYWELDPADKRGTFNVTGYAPNFVLPPSVMARGPKVVTVHDLIFAEHPEWADATRGAFLRRELA